MGIDPSIKMLNLAKSKGLNVSCVVAEKLLFKKFFFNFALMVTTVCFEDDIEASFKEAIRILKQNGKVIVGLVDKISREIIKLCQILNTNIFLAQCHHVGWEFRWAWI